MNTDNFNPNKCTSKEMPVLSALFDQLMTNAFCPGNSEQREELLEANRELRSKVYEIIKNLKPQQRIAIEADEELAAKLEYMELSEKFCAGFKLGAMLMKEIFDQTHD